MSDEVDDLLDKTETISRTEYRKETKSRRSTKYKKFADLAERLEKLEDGGKAKKVSRITESQVSSIRTQVEKLNHDDATKKDEKEYIATRRKITENGEDVTDEDGKKLYNLYIAHKEPTEDPSGGDKPSAEPEQQEVSENGTGGGEEYEAEKAVG